MLLRQFRSFYARHFPNEMEQLIDYFAVFGGLGWSIDIDAPIEELIVSQILDNYGHLYNQLLYKIGDDFSYWRLLSAVATGDRRMHSAFKRARISEAKGGAALKYLRDCGILEFEYSREMPPVKLHPKQKFKREVARHRISHKVRFTSPFLRFWFAFIAPFYKEIEKGDYAPVLERFEQRRQGFTGLIFEELSNLIVLKRYENDPIVDTGSYWDRHVEIDLYAQSASGKSIIGECKWTNHKTNKSELSKLLDKCERTDIKPDKVMMFSKRGFSNELMHQANDALELYTAEDMQQLLQEITPSDIINGFEAPEILVPE